VAQTAHALHAAAAGTAALLDQWAQVPGQPERIDYPIEITQWRASADQAAHMAQRWQQQPTRSVAQGGAVPSAPGPYPLIQDPDNTRALAPLARDSRTHPPPPASNSISQRGLLAGAGWFPASQRWSRVTRPPSCEPANVIAEAQAGSRDDPTGPPPGAACSSGTTSSRPPAASAEIPLSAPHISFQHGYGAPLPPCPRQRTLETGQRPLSVPARRCAEFPIWIAHALISIVSTPMQNGGSARVLVNPPVSLNVMLE
jgi:hypothetical protein